MTQRLPDFLGLGVQKGGTTTLQCLLEQHPQVWLSPQKELHYFSLHYGHGVDWYAEQFSAAAAHQRCGDITPYYIFHPEAPARIHALLPQARMIVLLRDPVERTLSQVFHAQRLGFEPLELEEALAAEPQRLAGAEAFLSAADGVHRSHQEHSYLARSRYELQLARYRQYFSNEQLLVLRSEDLFRAPQHTWEILLTFLGLDHYHCPGLPKAKMGEGEAAGVPPSLRSCLREQLAPTYRDLEQTYGISW